MVVRTENGSTPILMYHSIADLAAPRFRQFTVPPALFADHMTYLYQHDYTPLTVTQACAQRAASLPGKPVVITFDDGFADFYTNALPILSRYHFPATLYVTSGFVGSTSRWLRHLGEADRPMLTWEQLAEINTCGIECGSHSQHHPQLDSIPVELARQEIVGSKHHLEDRLSQPVLSFAYPFGYHSAAVRQLVRAAGYTSACAVAYKISSAASDPFALERLKISADTDINMLAALLSRSGAQVALAYLRARSVIWQLVRHATAMLRRGAPREEVW